MLNLCNLGKILTIYKCLIDDEVPYGCMYYSTE
jgi:hypothetical protein